jgi:hypothetical protein
MQSNEYDYDDYGDYGANPGELLLPEDDGMMINSTQLLNGGGGSGPMDINFDDPKIANLPRVLLMGPRRGGKTSIQVS